MSKWFDLQYNGIRLIEVTKDSKRKNQKKITFFLNPLNANPTKWPNTFKQFVGKLPTSCLSVFGHFVNLAVKGLTIVIFRTTANI